MKMLLQREALTEKSTAGRLFVAGAFECYTLEDTMREDPRRPVAEWKIKGRTAIPTGDYRVTLAPSPKRGGRVMPLLLAVPGFVGIQIHSGNTAEDTEGCILVGEWHENADTIRGSKLAFDKLFPKIQAAVGRMEEVRIEVKNP
jgi:hypothetical protein